MGNTDVTAGFLTGGGDEEDETLVTNATMMHVLTQLGELTSIVKEDRKARAGPGAEARGGRWYSAAEVDQKVAEGIAKAHGYDAQEPTSKKTLGAPEIEAMVADAVQRLMKDDPSRGPSTEPAYTAEDVDRMIGEALKGQVQERLWRRGRRIVTTLSPRGSMPTVSGSIPATRPPRPTTSEPQAQCNKSSTLKLKRGLSFGTSKPPRRPKTSAPPPVTTLPWRPSVRGRGKGRALTTSGTKTAPARPAVGRWQGQEAAEPKDHPGCAKCQPGGASPCRRVTM